MGKSKRAHRPTKVMMLAVNAAIDGDDGQVDRLLKEYKLDKEELEARLLARNNQKYELAGRKRSTKPGLESRSTMKTRTQTVDLNVTIDGRTSVAKLFKLIDQAEGVKARAQRELKRRPPEQIEPVKRALADIELLRRERRKLEEKIQEAEVALG